MLIKGILYLCHWLLVDFLAINNWPMLVKIAVCRLVCDDEKAAWLKNDEDLIATFSLRNC